MSSSYSNERRRDIQQILAIGGGMILLGVLGGCLIGGPFGPLLLLALAPAAVWWSCKRGPQKPISQAMPQAIPVE